MWIDRRVLVGAVAISVLLNVFLIGIVGGHLFALRRAVTRPRAADAGAVVPRVNLRSLPSEDKRGFETVMASHREAIREARRAVRAARAAVETDIVAPTYDRTRVAADFAALRQASQTLQENVNLAVVEALAGLPLASREILVRRPESRPPRP